MKAFVFSLEKVRTFRKKQWEAETTILAALHEQYQVLDKEMQDTIASLERAARALCTQKALDGEGVNHYAFVSESSRRALRRLKLRVEELEVKLNRQREVCVVAKREYELVSKLRASRWEAWRREEDREQETLSTESFLARRTQRSLVASSRKESRIHSAANLPLPEAEATADGRPTATAPG